PQYMIPAAFVFVDAYPLTPNGKVDRRALLATDVGTAQRSRSSVPLRPGLESVVGRVWRETLNVPQVWADDNFFELGGSSLLGVRLLANLEKVVGQRLPVSVLFEGQTVRAMAAALGHDFGDEALSLAVRIRSGGDRPPLFLVPGLNGNVIGYESLANALPADVPVYGLRSLGLNGEAEPLTDVESIAARFLEEVRRVQPHGPYFLSGFCIGGIIAYEMAQWLVAAGEHVELLALVGTWPPWAVENNLSTSQSAQRLAYLRNGVIRHLKALWAQPPGERLNYLRRKARIVSEMVERRDVYRGEATTFRHDLVSRVNRNAAATYKPRAYAGDILIVIPDDASPPADQDPRLAWRNLVSGESSLVRVPGQDSGALLRPSHIDALIGVLSDRIQAAGLIANRL
ncbi:MAG TPA: alpha/beta fold hydrolase, partial [Gemmatimonadaceae bacterium]